MAERPPEPALRVLSDGEGVALVGVIDEGADLSFFARLSGTTRLNLRGVRRINSFGVRSWIEGVRRIPPGADVELHECSPAMVDQLNMIAGFGGRARVISFLAPLACERCGLEQEELFGVAEYRRRGQLPAVACPRCAAPMHIDDLEEHYLLFAREAE